MVKGTFHKGFNVFFELGSKTLERWGQDIYESCAPVDVLDFFCCAGGMPLGFAAIKVCKSLNVWNNGTESNKI